MSRSKRSAAVVPFRGSGWRQMALGRFAPSVDPNQPAAYIADVKGQRFDGVVFTMHVALDKRKIDMITTPQQALNVCRDAMQNAMDQLQTFASCACEIGKSCREHQTQ